MRTQVAIIGAGPAGLMLSHLLAKAGVASVILERRSRAHVEQRIRAGVLEQTTVDLMRAVGAGARMDREGHAHEGFRLALEGESFRIDLRGLTGGKCVMVYGQTEVTHDLIAGMEDRAETLLFEADGVTLSGIDTSCPSVGFTHGGAAVRLSCDYIAGCDGFRGVCRAAIPAAAGRVYERVYPFGWLGILADVPPCDDELIYANHARGFALASMRSPRRSRYYIQVDDTEQVSDWPDDRLWDELALRLGPAAAARMVRGPALEKSIARLRSYVFEPMRHGALFLAGDAAHIVPPTGAKGLNLAMGDVKLLAAALAARYAPGGTTAALDAYSDRALARVWQAERFSWWFTGLTHRFPTMDAFDRKLQIAELAYLRRSRPAQASLAENYVGLEAA